MTLRAGGLLVPNDHYRELTQATANSAGFTTTEVVTDTLVANLISGQRYRVVHDGSWQTTVAADAVLLRIREDSLTGTALQAYRVGLPIAATTFAGHVEGFYTAVANGSKTFVVAVVRSGGTGTITRVASAAAPSNFYIESW
jgi:hypothetical protein